MAYELGTGPGSKPNTERPQEFKTIVHSWMTPKTGMARGTVGAWLEEAVTADVPLFRRRPHWETNPKTGDAVPVFQYAPVEGADWEATWGQAATMPVPTTNRRREVANDKAREKDKKARAVLAEAQQIVAAWPCPVCGREGSTLVAVCDHCDTGTQVADLPGMRGIRAQAVVRQSAPLCANLAHTSNEDVLIPCIPGCADLAQTPEPVEEPTPLCAD